MNYQRLYEILEATTTMFRKGEPVTVERTAGLEVRHVYAMPHVDEAPADLEMIDVHFIVVGVDLEAARTHEPELRQILAGYPEPERLAGGPSYIELGGVLGSQDAALRLFALGKALGLWSIITPATLHVEGEAADMLAGQGMILCSGLAP